MAITEKQKKFLWIGIGVVTASYIFPWLLSIPLMFVYRGRTHELPAPPYRQPSAMPKPVSSPARGGPAQTTDSSSPIDAAPDPAAPFPGKLLGIWQGTGICVPYNMCALKLELQENQQSKGQFTGYSTLACISLTWPKTKAIYPLSLMANAAPSAAILAGVPYYGSLKLHADKNIGADSSGCIMTAMTVTPFGTGEIAADWQRRLPRRPRGHAKGAAMRVLQQARMLGIPFVTQRCILIVLARHRPKVDGRISGKWESVAQFGPITETVRFEFEERGLRRRGRSLRELRGPGVRAYALGSITGSLNNDGTEYTLNETLTRRQPANEILLMEGIHPLPVARWRHFAGSTQRASAMPWRGHRI